MSQYAFVQVRNWTRHQHYTKRKPSWIKVYTELMSDADFLAMEEWQQGQLLKLWLLAAERENKLPGSNSVLARCINSPTSGRYRFNVGTFLALNYLEEWQEQAVKRP